jgi:hypothetical protein
MGVAMAVAAPGGPGVAGLNGLCVQASIVRCIRVGMAFTAVHLARSWIMRYGLDVGVAIGAVETAVNRPVERVLVDMGGWQLAGNLSTRA